ncbi:MAG: O-antigen ligase family protein [Dolichospermum sp.]
MDFVNQLLNFIATPLGFILIGTGLFIVIQANQKRPRLGWFLIAIFGFSASLSKFANEFIKEPPALVFPLQQLREVGRPLTIVLLGLLIVISLKTKNIWRKKVLPEPIFYLILVQTVIFCKILFYGNIGFAFLSAATFGGLVLMVILGPSRWLQNDQNFQLGVWAIAMVGVIFGVANGYQALIDKYAITFVHGWFLGTTGNPQQAALLIYPILPCLLFFIIRPEERYFIVRLLWLGLLFIALFALFMTGSRSGTLMGILSLLVFLRANNSKIIWGILLFGVIITALLPLLNSIDINSTSHINSDPSKEFLTPVLDKWMRGENTRTNVWNGYWQAFLNDPLLGIPFEGERLRFGESSWLGVLGSLGIVGAIPMLMFGLKCLTMLNKLHHLSIRRPEYYLKCSVIIGGLASLLIGGFSEAHLLGNLTFSVLAVLMYIVLGYYILEVAEREQKYFISDYHLVHPDDISRYK